MKILVVGLGNPILGDDGVGWRVANEVRTLIKGDHNISAQKGEPVVNISSQVQFELLSVGGLRLMEQLVGYDYVIIIDSIIISGEEPGKVIIASLDNLVDYQAGHMTSTHDTSLQTAVQMGKLLGASLPHEVDIVGIKVNQNFEFSENLSEKIEKAVPLAVEIVNNLIQIKITSEGIP